MRTKMLLLFLLFLGIGCKEQIIHNLSEKEANQLLTKLHESSLNPQKVKQPDGTWAISVEQSDVMHALKYLDDSRLLRSQTGTPRKGSSMISSREEQQFEFERARSREIESTLASVEGVLEARVHLNIEKADPLLGRSKDYRKNSSASVLLITTSGYDIANEDIASLIAGASGIDPEKVKVLINPSGSAESQMNGNTTSMQKLDPSPGGTLLPFVEAEQIIMILGGVLFVVGIVLLGHSLFPRISLRRTKANRSGVQEASST